MTEAAVSAKRKRKAKKSSARKASAVATLVAFAGAQATLASDLERKRAALQAELDGIAAVNNATSFESFLKERAPRYYPVPRHLKRLIQVCQETRSRPVRCLLSMPPRHGKTTTISNLLSWRSMYDPACLNFYATYSLDLAEETSRKARKMVRDVAKMPLAQDRVIEWRTKFGGGLKATSLGGPITGRGCNGGVIVCDDVIKGREIAESKLARDRAWDWFLADVMSRLEEGDRGTSSVIIINTRWHDDDIIGRLIKDGHGDDWELINMPAVSDAAGEPLDHRLYEGGIPLWPEAGYDLRWAEKVRRRSEYDWWSLYQGVPRSKHNRIFGSDPTYFDPTPFVGKKFAFFEGKRACITLDPAATEGTVGDHSAIAICAMRGYGSESVMEVLHVERHQVSVPAITRRVHAMQKEYRLLIAVEAVGGFKAIPQTLREIAPGIAIVEISPNKDKFTRAQAAASAYSEGRIRFPAGAPWLDEVISELKEFTGLGDAHDDMVDAIVHAWNTLYREKPGRDSSEPE